MGSCLLDSEIPLADRLIGRLPVSAEQLERLLLGEGRGQAPLSLTQLARLCRAEIGRVPFRVVRCGGMEIAVASADHVIATRVATAALHLARHWGLVSVQAVMDRARALDPAPVAETAALAVLGALPRTRWLDADRRWFSFVDSQGQLETSLAKVFSVTPRVRLDELRAALAKALPGAQHAPVAALRCYLVELGRCTIEDSPDRPDHPVLHPFVRRAHRAPAGRGEGLTRQEAAVVKLLEAAAGRELDIGTLRRRARAAGLPRTTVNQLIRLSPLFPVVAPQGRVRLIGDGALAVYA